MAVALTCPTCNESWTNTGCGVDKNPKLSNPSNKQVKLLFKECCRDGVKPPSQLNSLRMQDVMQRAVGLTGSALMSEQACLNQCPSQTLLPCASLRPQDPRPSKQIRLYACFQPALMQKSQ